MRQSSLMIGALAGLAGSMALGGVAQGVQRIVDSIPAPPGSSTPPHRSGHAPGRLRTIGRWKPSHSDAGKQGKKERERRLKQIARGHHAVHHEPTRDTQEPAS